MAQIAAKTYLSSPGTIKFHWRFAIEINKKQGHFWPCLSYPLNVPSGRIKKARICSGLWLMTFHY